MEEEIVYRDGLRYVNRFNKLTSGEKQIITKEESPLTKEGAQRPFKVTSMSDQLFLQKTSKKQINGRTKIDVHFACPVLQKPWCDLKKNDRITFVGKFLDSQNEPENRFVLGVCKTDDLGSYVDEEKSSITNLEANTNPQQAVVLGFPLQMSYYILTNLVEDAPEKNVLIYHEREEISSLFACVALSLDVKIVCLTNDRASKERLRKMYDLLVVTVEEIARAEVNAANLAQFDAVCLLSDCSEYVYRQIVNHLKPDGSVIILHEDKNLHFNPFAQGKNIRCVVTNLPNITEGSENFEKLFSSCYFHLKSKGLLERLLNIPLRVSSIYDVMNNGNNNQPSESEKAEIGLSTVSFKPDNTPEKVAFYSLPLDANGLKDDRTYLVIGGVRGFGFEVAKWMVENGAKTVVCTARSPPSEEKKVEVQRLEQETGSQILLRQADVTSWKDMNVIKDELESLPAVAGIVFTAMVLADQLLINADLETCKKVVQTKVKGEFSNIFNYL
jgi:hypothetical protein